MNQQIFKGKRSVEIIDENERANEKKIKTKQLQRFQTKIFVKYVEMP